MYVDVRRGLAFFDRSDRVMGGPLLRRFDPATGGLQPVAGARDDDVVEDVSPDGERLVLRSADWLTVRGASRSRLTFVERGVPTATTDRFLSHWAVCAPGEPRALVGTLNGKSLPVVLGTLAGTAVALVARGFDARVGDVDPQDGRLWVPDDRARDGVLAIDCATGVYDRRAVPIGARPVRLRFARDGASLFVVGEKETLSRHARDGTPIWSLDVSAYGRVGAGNLFMNEQGSHLLLSLPASKVSSWGEDLVVEAGTGRLETTRPRRQGPPARLAADWFGDGLLTHAGEIADIFTGRVTGQVLAAS